ncbi:hypothetical protein D3C73_1510600 [compost metagenome]
MICTVLLAESQTAAPPVASAMNRKGMYVVPLVATGAVVNFLTSPLTVARLLPTLSRIARFGPVPVTVPVLASQSTLSPSFSNTTRKGTSTVLLCR